MAPVPVGQEQQPVHLDTQIVVWMFLAGKDMLSKAAKAAIEASDDLLVSPLVLLELAYLHELGRLKYDGPTVMASLRDEVGLRVDRTPFAHVAVAARD